jgi:glucose/arabinose dehydrogenase
VTSEQRIDMQRRIRDIEEDRDGSLLALTDDRNGELLRITPSSSGGT